MASPYICWTGVMLRVRRTEESFPFSWIETTMLCLWHSPAASSEFLWVGVNAMGHAKSTAPFLSLPCKGRAPASLGKEVKNAWFSLFFLCKGMYCFTGPILWLVRPWDMWKSDTRHAVSIPFQTGPASLHICFIDHMSSWPVPVPLHSDDRSLCF